ncbi:MAG TPA: RHS repeat-associated core domain-containing protein [Bacillota bacterium]|nr:RHS repeat-associated core domain-containing protein [Bacillota bacterium]
MVKSDTFSTNSLSNWTVNDGYGADFIAENNAVTIVHTTVDYSGDYMAEQFNSLANAVIEFDAKIGLVNNDSASLDVESNGFNLAFIGGCLYYRKDGSDTWHLVSDFVADNIPFGQWNHFKLVLTAGRVEIYINDVLKYSQAGTFSAKSYLGFRDYGLCLGTVTSYVDNITVAACYGDYDYTGKKISQDTGLVYFGARFYDPEVGRFITQDPVKDGLNWYAYCNDNPVMYVDLTGLVSSKFDIGGPADYEHDFTDTILTTDGNGTVTSITTYPSEKGSNHPEGKTTVTDTIHYDTTTGEPQKEVRTYKDNNNNITREITYTYYRRTQAEATAINSTCKVVGGGITYLVIPPAVPWYIGLGASVGSNFIPYDVSKEGEVYVTVSYYVSAAQVFHEWLYGY